ncbi:MAG: hypothetical protein CK424_07130 [Legionella sp.]|nr:MAG: hypothetical protein CK424_07130 [Legionella sp.]
MNPTATFLSLIIAAYEASQPAEKQVQVVSLIVHLYKKILAAGKKELPPIPEKTTKRRGKLAKSDAHNLWERLEKYESVLLFAKHPHVPFTNNRAERAIYA